MINSSSPIRLMVLIMEPPLAKLSISIKEPLSVELSVLLKGVSSHGQGLRSMRK